MKNNFSSKSELPKLNSKMQNCKHMSKTLLFKKLFIYPKVPIFTFFNSFKHTYNCIYNNLTLYFVKNAL